MNDSLNKINILGPYPYMNKEIISLLQEFDSEIRFLLDSGAFTAWKSGKSIDVDDYCKFIETLPIKPWKYFTLDKIGDPEGSLKNYEIMLKRGFNPIPIFTRGEDINILDEYYKTSDIVGIGGLVGTQGNKGFVKAIMKIINKRKCHWLGFTNKNFVKYYKPYSCDSSSLMMANKFASIELFNKTNGEWIKLSKNDFKNKPKEEIIQLIESYKVNPKDLSISKNWSGGNSFSSYLSFRSHIRASICYKQKLDTYYFLAIIGFVAKGYLDKAVKIFREEMLEWKK